MAHESLPVDQRWLGLDRRAMPYAIVAVVLIVVMHWVLPAIDGAVAWDDATEAGDVVDLGSGITVVPPVGWQLEDGILVGADTATPVNADRSSALVANGGVTVTVTGSGWDGTANELMDQYNRVRDKSDADDDKIFKVTSDRQSFTTTGGVTGVSESYTSATGEGTAYAFVVTDDQDRPIGITVSASTGDDTLGRYQQEIEAMVSSLASTGADR